ncbi:MAG TPA: 50S ribosomal protein L25 [Candidatus Mediterraneibacter quadrami]|jgi:large subunit ribosomal protein L25|uniref:50S ribosomal protein L25 n=1 Tax=Candidatus Mediterraneibacter quadrami TaxID=2838684 RepID=A0A9D2RDE5_9FIRM|nr:50S ribosomal protein L25 [Candidatus Mediterraneibacter quadrami]
MNTLKAEKRDMSIKAKKLRREGFVTGCIFGREMKETIPLKMLKGDVEKLLKTEGKGGRVALTVDGQTYDALIKEVDFNPLKGGVDEMDFQALVSTEKVHSSAEIHLINADKLVAGVPQQMLHEVDFKALPSALVEKIELDIGDLKVGDTIRVADLDIAKDKDVDLTTDPEATVVTVTEVRGAAAETEDEDAAEAE